ncbi:hypothetical protein NEOLI_003719 [Neolecta irregularis DAH-3]|uniref:Uncharacterized protein n=1 Tax=Neolecta irregularis (strain DAH-3) TaxID=1198029 RepID=A0A1U7LU97_NEOID|nr:hypothetical protein NEOLI_003719 [Neolecta irregularis DAH-3]|eukprot:OLL26188.1 hypothetical protein NEOLI_003719 [Neolecta irregularis DAH-3]
MQLVRNISSLTVIFFLIIASIPAKPFETSVNDQALQIVDGLKSGTAASGMKISMLPHLNALDFLKEASVESDNPQSKFHVITSELLNMSNNILAAIKAANNLPEHFDGSELERKVLLDEITESLKELGAQLISTTQEIASSGSSLLYYEDVYVHLSNADLNRICQGLFSSLNILIQILNKTLGTDDGGLGPILQKLLSGLFEDNGITGGLLDRLFNGLL